MKVLFLKDVARVARAGDIKEIKDGYGRNYLLPQGLAVAATKDAIARSEGLRKSAEERRLKEAADWQEVADALGETPVEIEARAGPTGRLYGSITNTIVAEKLSEMTGREVDRRSIRFREPVRQTGEFNVPLRLHENVGLEIKLIVTAEGSEDAPETRPEAQQDEEPAVDARGDDAEPPDTEETSDEAQDAGS